MLLKAYNLISFITDKTGRNRGISLLPGVAKSILHQRG
jgi:hypothetical protein